MHRFQTFLFLMAQEAIVGMAYVVKGTARRPEGKGWKMPGYHNAKDLDTWGASYQKDLFGIFPRQSVLGYLQNQFRVSVDNDNRTDHNFLFQQFLRDEVCHKHLTEVLTDPASNLKVNYLFSSKGRDHVGGPGFFHYVRETSPVQDQTYAEIRMEFKNTISFADSNWKHNDGTTGGGYSDWFDWMLAQSEFTKVQDGAFPDVYQNEEARAMLGAFYDTNKVTQITPTPKGEDGAFVFEWRALDNTETLEKLVLKLAKHTATDVS